MPDIESKENQHPPETQRIVLEHIGAKANEFRTKEAELAEVADAIKKVGGYSLEQLAPYLDELKELAGKVDAIEKLLEEGTRTFH